MFSYFVSFFHRPLTFLVKKCGDNDFVVEGEADAAGGKTIKKNGCDLHGCFMNDRAAFDDILYTVRLCEKKSNGAGKSEIFVRKVEDIASFHVRTIVKMDSIVSSAEGVSRIASLIRDISDSLDLLALKTIIEAESLGVDSIFAESCYKEIAELSECNLQSAVALLDWFGATSDTGELIAAMETNLEEVRNKSAYLLMHFHE